MELQLQNIGMIKESIIKLDGLTVIAGENNIGKSTVGKLIFSLIKSSSRYDEDLEEGKDDKLFSLMEKNYFEIRKDFNFSENNNLRDLFHPHRFRRDVQRYSFNAIDERIDFLEEIKETIEIQIYEKIKTNLLKIKEIFLGEKDIQKAQKNAFRKALISEFKGKITNQNSKNDASIKINESKNKILEITINKKDKITEFNIFDEFYFNDATFIESPIVLQLSESIQMSRTYFEILEDRKHTIPRPNVPLHIKDLNNKLKISLMEEDTLFDVEDLLNRYDVKKLLSILSDTMSGKIKYNKKIRDFQYIDNNGKIFDSLNTATGIKSLGIIQMLIKSGIIDQRSLLILDEPEVHLHPKWQLKYAELIVELVKNDINVLVTSHSPYMIQALIKYAKDANIIDKSNFYLAKRENNHSNIKNVNETLNEIFELLAEPMNEVYD